MSLQSLKQVNGHMQILKNAFSRYKCMECGICCSDKPHEVIVLPKDPNKAGILDEAVRRFPKSIVPVNFTTFYIIGQDHCPFLDKNESQSRCSIYPIRPIVCNSFPFMIQSLSTKTEEEQEPVKKEFIVLSSLCPPVADARNEGMRFITPLDIALMKKNPMLKAKLSMLVKSFSTIQEYGKAGIAFAQSLFLEAEGKRIIPLF